MGRTSKPLPSVERAIKLTLHPVHDADVIEMIDGAPNKARMVIDALRGRRVTTKVEPTQPKVRDQLVAFLS